MACIPGVVGLHVQCRVACLQTTNLQSKKLRLQKSHWKGRWNVPLASFPAECRAVTGNISEAGADWNPVRGSDREEIAVLQDEVSRTKEQARRSEARLQQTLVQLSEMQELVDKLLKGRSSDRSSETLGLSTAAMAVAAPPAPPPKAGVGVNKGALHVSGQLQPYSKELKNFWYPVAFSKDIDKDTLVPLESFEEPWVLFRGADGKPGCLRDECAHRACPLSLGAVTEDGRVQCPYHGWEYSTNGACEKIPSTKASNVKVRVLPCVEQDGMIWIWPGDETPSESFPCLNPPEGYTIHAQIVLELPVEHGLLVENLLDLAHAPFTHTTTFAKGWSVPDLVRFKTVEGLAMAMKGNWDPYPIDMQFQPPCMVLSTIGLAKPGKLQGKSAGDCKTHLHQLHVCMPSSSGKTRLLYRMALDFAGWVKHVPFIDRLWMYLANQVLAEDLRLVEGQQDRMRRGANVWNHPVGYDKLGLRYRRWRNAVEAGETAPFG